MSKHSEPGPSCPIERPKAFKSVYGKCVKSSRIMSRTSHNTFCLKCFASAEITSPNYELVITHHLTNGLQDQYICTSCNQHLCHARPALECSLCSNRFTKLYFKFREQNIDINKSIFRVDVFTDTIDGSIFGV